MALVTKNFSDIITFTRASTGTFFNSAGVLTSAATNAPRFDFNPSTLAAQGLLIEESRANICLYSQAITTSPWQANGTETCVTSALIDPAGGTNAFTITFDAASFSRWRQPLTLVAGTTYTMSAWVRSISGTQIFRLRPDAGAATSGDFTATTTWQRFTWTFTTATTGGTFDFSNGSDGIVRSIVVYGAQLEAGAFPTSYIPTTTTALTRAADVASVNTLSPWYNASAGTLYAEVMLYALPPASTFPCYVDINNGTTNERFALSSNQFANHRVTVRNTAGNIWDTNAGGSIVANIASKWALAATSGDFSSAYNGIAGAVSSATGMPAGLTQMTIGAAGGGANRANGYLRRITYYPRRLSNAELQAITA